MKGFILSVSVFVLYVIFTAILSHVFKVERHSKLFLPGIGIAMALFVATYYISPARLWVLPAGWQATHCWLDVVLGLFILILNIHSYVDWFFAFNGGFSTSLMLLLYRSGNGGLSEQELIANYHDKDGRDKIHGWRLPRLEETGYIKIEEATLLCELTSKGEKVASLIRFIKRTLNLGIGG